MKIKLFIRCQLKTKIDSFQRSVLVRTGRRGWLGRAPTAAGILWSGLSRVLRPKYFETTDGKYDGFPRASQKMLWRKTDQISISETAVTKGIQDGFVILLFVCILWRKHEISDLIWLSKHKSEIPSSWYA